MYASVQTTQHKTTKAHDFFDNAKHGFYGRFALGIEFFTGFGLCGAPSRPLNQGLSALRVLEQNAPPALGCAVGGHYRAGKVQSRHYTWRSLAAPNAFNRNNSAYLFDGVSGYISVPHDATLDPTDQMTIAFWVKINSPSNTYMPIIHKGGIETSNYGTNREYALWMHSTPCLLSTSAGDSGCNIYPQTRAIALCQTNRLSGMDCRKPESMDGIL